MNEQASELIRSLPDEALPGFAVRLADWLLSTSAAADDDEPVFSESRARAILRADELLDGESLTRFGQLFEQRGALRVALYELVATTGLAGADNLESLRPPAEGTVSDVPAPHPLSLVVAAHAWRAGYPIGRLDPASPPGRYSPAGQVLQRAAQFIRSQISRTATERDRLANALAFRPATSNLPRSDAAIPPLPPHFRPPVPIRYPEVARETLHIDSEELPEAAQVSRGEPITISEEDVANAQPPARRARVTSDEVTPRQPSRRRAHRRVGEVGSTLTSAVRQLFARQPMKTTRLRVEVRQEPDGPGLYGLQVCVRCRGVNSFVAGTTNRDGVFVCELPVPEDDGLTYGVDVTWPRDMNGEVERKSITLNADRTEFVLPFYRQLNIQ